MDFSTRQYNLHSSCGDCPYLGTHLTFTSMPWMPKLLLFISAHCCSRKSGVSGGQSWMLHDRYLIRDPMQYLPPLAGAGELHSRVDDCTPPPHCRLHWSNLIESKWRGMSIRIKMCKWESENCTQKINSNEKIIRKKSYGFHAPHPPSIFVSACRFLGTHFPCWHQCPAAHSVPSAQGMCCVRHPSLSLPHHNRTHGGYNQITKHIFSFVKLCEWKLKRANRCKTIRTCNVSICKCVAWH